MKKIRKKLINWYKDEKEIRKAKARKKFQQARPKSGESYFAFSNRLENLFNIAYPRHVPKTSNTLVYQFKAAVSKPMKQILDSEMMSSQITRQEIQLAYGSKVC